MKKNYRKILIIFLVISVLFSTPLVLPKKTQAFTVTDLVNLIPNLGTWVNRIMSYVTQITQYIQDKMGPMMRDVLAKRILDYIVDETLKWVQGGGEPKFVGDWQGFLKHAGDIALDSLVKDLGLSRLCSPFSLQVKLSLAPVPEFSQQVDCTLEDVVGNIENFYQDFESGGWVAYNEIWQPQGNYYGTMLMLYDEAMQRIAAQTRASEDEALAGGGYLSTKKSTSDSDSPQGTTNIGGNVTYSSDADSPQGTINISGSAEQITTPGSTIGATVDRAVQTDMEWASNIESWMSALINAAITRLTSQGIRDMMGSAETYTSYYPSEYQNMLDQETKQQQQQLINQVKPIVDEWKYFVDAKSKTIPVAEQLKTVLAQISAEGCYVADGEIQGVQTDIDTLRSDIIDLGNKITEGNNLMDELAKAKTAEERIISSQHNNAFMDKYNTNEIQEAITKTPANAMGQNSADAKYSSVASALSAAQARLSECQNEDNGFSFF